MKTKVQIDNTCLQSDSSMPCQHRIKIGDQPFISMFSTDIKKYIEDKNNYESVYISNSKISIKDNKLVIEEYTVPLEHSISDNDHLYNS